MGAFLKKIFHTINSMPPSRKLMMGLVTAVVLGGFAVMFFWANKIDFQPAYSNLASEDAAEIMAKLKEKQIPYQLSAGGSIILVPSDKVYEVRLGMAGEGIPRGGSVGFELFNKTDFGATDFVQKLNYQRALQGELARTIREFREVENARVLVVLPKESVFIEASKPPSASVLLKLKAALSEEKVDAVVHLVASAVANLTPERVTVVDTTGKVLSKGADEQPFGGNLAHTQLEYKAGYEANLTKHIQSMLERIVGKDKAIVRVTADMDFSQVDINEELYDPDAQVVRSRQSSSESSDHRLQPRASVSSVNPISAPEGAGAGRETSDSSKRQEETVNYEINRTVRRTVRPVGIVKRLSVAAVLDGTYQTETDSEGNPSRKYVARSAGELEQFKQIVQNAMGYNADREDQVSVESFPLAYMDDMALDEAPGIEWIALARRYGRSVINLVLIMLVFLFIVRPLVRSMKQMKTAMIPAPVGGAEAGQTLPPSENPAALPEPSQLSSREQAGVLADQDLDKAADLVKGWLNEA